MRHGDTSVGHIRLVPDRAFQAIYELTYEDIERVCYFKARQALTGPDDIQPVTDSSFWEAIDRKGPPLRA